MKKRLAVLTAAALIGGLGVILAAPPAQAVQECDGYVSGFIGESLVVKQGDVCRLYNATVGGSITVEPGGALFVYSGGGGEPSHITGSITATRGQVFVEDSKVDGSITVVRPRYLYGTNTDVFPPSVLLCGNRIGGSVTVRNAPNNGHGVDIGLCQVCYVDAGRPVQQCWDEANGNLIGGSLRVRGNRTLVRIYFNTIGGSVACTDNVPDPEFHNNIVGGSVTGECP